MKLKIRSPDQRAPHFCIKLFDVRELLLPAVIFTQIYCQVPVYFFRLCLENALFDALAVVIMLNCSLGKAGEIGRAHV